MAEDFEQMLTGGHPNSLGRTLEVVETVLADHSRFNELFRCYQSEDEVVRLRTSSAIKRVEAEVQALLIPYIDRLLNEVSTIDQASTQWTLAQLFLRLQVHLSGAQRNHAVKIMQHNLVHSNDWIVLNATMETLWKWCKSDIELRDWLRPELERLTSDRRKSVARRATKYINTL